MIGIAVGSQDLKVMVIEKNSIKEEEDVLTMPNNEDGLSKIMALAGPNGLPIVLAGNRRWAKTLAYALAEHGKQVRYISPPKTERGQKVAQAKFLRNALLSGAKGRPFFEEKFGKKYAEEPVSYPWVELAMRVPILNNDLRRCKHRILNTLRVLFPELVSLGTKLWGKKALAALREQEYAYFYQRYEMDKRRSLSRYVPDAKQADAKRELAGLLAELQDIQDKLEKLKEEIDRVTRSHPVVQMFSGSDSAKLLALLIGWRTWGKTKKDFRVLRNYAGLAVTRLDSKGKPRISRERPAIRTALYFLLRTSEGEQIIEDAAARLDRELKPRPKRMEILLKEIWRRCLKETA